MQLRTYTGLWGVEKRLYKFYDIALPYPVSVKQLGIFLVSGVTWLGLMTLFQVPFDPPWNVVWLAPPFLITYYANRPVAEGKSLADFVISQVKYFAGDKVYTALAPTSANLEKKRLFAKTWKRTSS
jgi:hypothetical protein